MLIKNQIFVQFYDFENCQIKNYVSFFAKIWYYLHFMIIWKDLTLIWCINSGRKMQYWIFPHWYCWAPWLVMQNFSLNFHVLWIMYALNDWFLNTFREESSKLQCKYLLINSSIWSWPMFNIFQTKLGFQLMLN